MKNFIILSLMIPACWSLAVAQQEADIYEKAYQERISQEYLNGVYIPADLTDAFAQLNKLISKEAKAKFKGMTEEDAAVKLHARLGRWIIYNWEFYGGSRLGYYIRKLGISHPDDMARFLIVSYHRYLNKKPLDIKGQIEFYREKFKKDQEERLKKGTVIYQETRKRPKDKGQ